MRDDWEGENCLYNFAIQVTRPTFCYYHKVPLCSVEQMHILATLVIKLVMRQDKCRETHPVPVCTVYTREKAEY